MFKVTRIIPDDLKENGLDKSYDESFSLICRNIKIDIRDQRFVYFIDDQYVMDTSKGVRLENLTPAYDKILKCGLAQFKYNCEDNKFCKSYNLVIDGMMALVERIIRELENNDTVRPELTTWFKRLRDVPANGFEEAIQRMLFVNQLMWQTDHRLTGLGAWDSILWPYYTSDIEKGLLDRTTALRIIEDVYHILHEDYLYKSNALMGDTGEIFVLGKSTINGEYLCNELTYLFIEAMKNVRLTEPKCLLRVNSNTPRDLMELSLDAISTGIGAPLLANDDVIVPQLVEFGIPVEDALEYTTSACWEPLIGGKSSSNNNRAVLNYACPLDNMLKREKLKTIKTFDELQEKYLIYLRRYIRSIKRSLLTQRYQYDPFLSVFMYDCFENKKDVSQGGCRYKNIGMTSVAIGNVINSFYNIKKLVFEQKRYSLYDIKRILTLNYEGEETLLEELRSTESVYGTDEDEIIELVNMITDCVAEEIRDFRSFIGEKLKVGLSGSTYLDSGKGSGATFDGRKKNEPFIVHISNEDNNDFTSIVNFASNIDYGHGRFNGNVIDMMVSPNFINDNKQKFVDFLLASIKSGFFEMQMNVVSSKTLIVAREHPEAFPNLIVRVWGFSAYFSELPDEYKEVLIKRALRNEHKEYG